MLLDSRCWMFSILLCSVLARQFPTNDKTPYLPQDVELFSSAFDEFVKQVLNTYHVPALSIAVVKNERTTSKGYGISRFPSVPATADTMYYTGSTTKAFISAAMALMIQDPNKHHDFTWTSHVFNLLPEFRMEDDHATTHTTIEDMLSHRTGLGRHDRSYGWTNDSAGELLAHMPYLPITAEPRTKFQYCNIMFGLAGRLLERLSKMWIGDLLREKLWEPLGMRSTFFSLDTAKEYLDTNPNRNLARGYSWVDGEGGSSGFYVPEPYIDIGHIAGAGATISTVNDFALWIRAFLHAGQANMSGNKSSPINRALFKDVTTPRSFVTSEFVPLPGNSYINPPYYGFGWLNTLIEGRPIISHGGGLPGFGTQLYILPDDGLGIVTMGNTVGTGAIAGAIISAVIMQRELNLTGTDIFSSLDNALELQKATTKITSLVAEPFTGSSPSLQACDVTNTAPHPFDMNFFTGLYSHPAYGTVNVTNMNTDNQNMISTDNHLNQATINPGTTLENNKLSAIFSPRLFPVEFILEHRTKTFFTANWLDVQGPFQPDSIPGLDIGCEPPFCKNKVVREIRGQSLASFEIGPNGSVEKMGIEIEEGMFMDPRKLEKVGGWRDAMIWFDRI